MNDKKVREFYTIALCSDVHCGDSRFSEALMRTAVKEINESRADMVVVAGDLTANGYREQFEQAKCYIDLIDSPQKLVIAGNHDHRNVGWVHFEDFFGSRFKALTFDFRVRCHGVFQEKVKIVAADSCKPDLNDGEVGRRHYYWIKGEFVEGNDFKIFCLHHHLVSVPGTGRERNIVWDAGDVLEVLKDSDVDMVLCGHKHVPYIWMVDRMILVNSGTMSTYRTRGYAKPAYNLIRIHHDKVHVETRVPGEGLVREEEFGRLRTPPPVLKDRVKS